MALTPHSGMHLGTFHVNLASDMLTALLFRPMMRLPEFIRICYVFGEHNTFRETCCVFWQG